MDIIFTLFGIENETYRNGIRTQGWIQPYLFQQIMTLWSISILKEFQSPETDTKAVTWEPSLAHTK